MSCSRLSLDRARRGFSLVEIMVAIAILSVALVPITSIVWSGNRVAGEAHRLLDATLHAQTILEALTQLEPYEIPSDASNEWILLRGSQEAAPGGSGRWPQVVSFFREPVPFPMERQVKARQLPDGRLIITVEIEFLRVPSTPGSSFHLVLEGLASPRGWQ